MTKLINCVVDNNVYEYGTNAGGGANTTIYLHPYFVDSLRIDGYGTVSDSFANICGIKFRKKGDEFAAKIYHRLVVNHGVPTDGGPNKIELAALGLIKALAEKEEANLPPTFNPLEYVTIRVAYNYKGQEGTLKGTLKEVTEQLTKIVPGGTYAYYDWKHILEKDMQDENTNTLLLSSGDGEDRKIEVTIVDDSVYYSNLQ